MAKSIKLHKAKPNASIRIEISLLDVYALKLYNKPYEDVSDEVNEDILNLAIKHKTVATKDIRLLITLELTDKPIKSQILSKYSGMFTTT